MGEILFECPTCGARHRRGFLNGVDVFRCLRCGYVGHGFHTDPEIDREVFEEHCAINALHRRLGIPELTLGVDPKDHAG